MTSKSLTSFFLCTIIMFSVSSSVLAVQADDTEAKALGGAYTARTKGAAAIFFNPAGLFGDSTFTVRTSVYWRNNDISIGPAESDDDAILHGTFAVSANLSDRFAVGVGYLPLFENSLNMDRMDLITDSAFATDFTINVIRPAVSYKLADGFSIGIGIDYYNASFNFDNYFKWTTQNIADSASFTIDQSLSDLSDSTFGFSFGFLGDLNDAWSVGAMYRHEAELELDGDAGFMSEVDRNSGTFVINEPALGGFVDPRPALRDQLPYSTNATMMMTLPSEFALGLYYKGSDMFSASADVRWAQWSSMADSKVTINNGIEYSFGESWDDTLSIHLGADYNLTDKITILGGYALAPSPISEDSVPQFFPFGDRQDISIGTRFHFDALSSETGEKTGALSFNFAFVFSNFDDLDSPDMSSNYPKLSSPFISVIPGFSSAVISNEAITFLFGISASFN